MPLEIERKFLVDKDHPELRAILATPGTNIRQGYITDASLIRIETGDGSGSILIAYGPRGSEQSQDYRLSIPQTDAREIIAALCVCDGSDAILKNGISRLRITDDKAWLTLKGYSSGISRAEFEYEVPVAHAAHILDTCMTDELRKRRHVHPIGNGLTAEIDVFADRDLILAEVELPGEDTPFAKPAWFATEVSEDPRYFNSNLARGVAP